MRTGYEIREGSRLLALRRERLEVEIAAAMIRRTRIQRLAWQRALALVDGKRAA